MVTSRLRFSTIVRRATLLAASCISAACLIPTNSWAADAAPAGTPAPTATPAGPTSASLRQPIRIVCIGDSITQGRRGDEVKGGKVKMVYSYRYPLWKMFVDADIPVDFVGSMKEAFDHDLFKGDPDWADYKGKTFPRACEGHWGWTTQGVADKLPGWIKDYTPDIALTLLGTNDMKEKEKSSLEPTLAAHRSLVAILRAKNPKVVILIGEPYEEWQPYPRLCTALAALAKELSTPESPVVAVEHAKGWVSKPDLPDTCTVDWEHPNQKGDMMLAKDWFEALQPFLKKAAK